MSVLDHLIEWYNAGVESYARGGTFAKGNKFGDQRTPGKGATKVSAPKPAKDDAEAALREGVRDAMAMDNAALDSMDAANPAMKGVSRAQREKIESMIRDVKDALYGNRLDAKIDLGNYLIKVAGGDMNRANEIVRHYGLDKPDWHREPAPQWEREAAGKLQNHGRGLITGPHEDDVAERTRMERIRRSEEKDNRLVRSLEKAEKNAKKKPHGPPRWYH